MARNLSNIVLQPCCNETLEDIRRRMKTANILQKIMLPFVVISAFIDPPGGKGSLLSTCFSIYQTDWAALAQATKHLPDIARAACRKEAHMEALKHSGKLADFWEAVVESY